MTDPEVTALDDIAGLSLGSDIDNVCFDQPDLDAVRSASVEHRSPNVTAMAAISGLCSNPHATSSSFASYTDSRQGAFIDEYEDDIPDFVDRQNRGGTSISDVYRDFALGSDDGDGKPDMSELSHQITNIESDINEMKATLENMVSDVSDASCSANDAAKATKEVSDTLDDAVSTMLDRTDAINDRIDGLEAMMKGIHETLHHILAKLQ